ncbi:(E)-4-hydroxy-3-methylbut-2-enyl-diphosphate synthase (flavodoxin), partial [hydrothermal vent metagenome]
MPTKFISREITIGNLRLGGNQPVRIQSMTNTPTMDTNATVKQIIRLTEAGCELVRVSAANVQEAESLRSIRKALEGKNINIPLIADIHFMP